MIASARGSRTRDSAAQPRAHLRSRALPIRLGVALLMLALDVNQARAAGPHVTPIDEARFVTFGGIEQWITVRGTDRTKPVLLVLHGGPADVSSPLVAQYAPFERDFVVVQWDQRGAGKTFLHAGARTQPTCRAASRPARAAACCYIPSAVNRIARVPAPSAQRPAQHDLRGELLRDTHALRACFAFGQMLRVDDFADAGDIVRADVIE